MKDTRTWRIATECNATSSQRLGFRQRAGEPFIRISKRPSSNERLPYFPDSVPSQKEWNRFERAMTNGARQRKLLDAGLVDVWRWRVSDGATFPRENCMKFSRLSRRKKGDWWTRIDGTGTRKNCAARVRYDLFAADTIRKCHELETIHLSGRRGRKCIYGFGNSKMKGIATSINHFDRRGHFPVEMDCAGWSDEFSDHSFSY